MTLTITKGMDGKRISTIGKYAVNDMEDNEIDKMFADFHEWKKNMSESKKYRVSSYDRQLFDDKNRKIIIDIQKLINIIKTEQTQNQRKYYVKRMITQHNLITHNTTGIIKNISSKKT